MDIGKVLYTLYRKGWRYHLKTTNVRGCAFSMTGRNEKVKAGVFGVQGYGHSPEEAVKSFVENAKKAILEQEERNEESKVSSPAGNSEVSA